MGRDTIADCRWLHDRQGGQSDVRMLRKKVMTGSKYPCSLVDAAILSGGVWEMTEKVRSERSCNKLFGGDAHG